MQKDRSPKNLYEITAQLRSWERAGFPRSEIKEIEDQTFITHLEFTRDELISPLTPTDLEHIRQFCYEDVVEMALEHGFEITCPNEKEGVFLPKVAEFFEYDEYGVGGYLIEDGGEFHFVDEEPEPSYGCVIRHWSDWIAMFYAREKGLFPSTDEQKKAVEFARKIKREAQSLRHIGRRSEQGGATVEAVFGEQRSLKAGVIIPSRSAKSRGSGREIVVEVRKRRGR